MKRFCILTGFLAMMLSGCVTLTEGEKIEVSAIRAKADAAIQEMRATRSDLEGIAKAVQAVADAIERGEIPLAQGKALIERLTASVPSLEARLKAASERLAEAERADRELQDRLAERGASAFGSIVATAVEAARGGSLPAAAVTTLLAICSWIKRRRAEAAAAKSDAGLGVVARAIGTEPDGRAPKPLRDAIVKELLEPEAGITRSELDERVKAAVEA
jgi:DNA repair exonuclease SbcCD ATPase subunit